MHRLRTALRCALVAIGAAFVLVTATPWITELGGQALSGQWNEPRGEVMIVLGAGGLDDGTIGDSSYWRSVYAVRAWKRHPFRKILVCGQPSAIAMRQFIIALGVPPEAVDMDERSTTTRENAEEARRWLLQLPQPPQGILLLSSDYHMYRSVRIFRKLGIDVIPHPISDARKRAQRWPGRWPAFLDLLTEVGKIAYYWTRGWI